MSLSLAFVPRPLWWLLGLAVLLLLWRAWRRYRQHRHRRYIRRADRALKRLAAIDHPAQQFAYLRKVSPYVFEEMVLTALKRAGYSIARSQRYSGDGGVDGTVVIDGHLVLIQSKRYGAHIRAADVRAFGHLCAVSRHGGLFVHTGRTGKMAREFAAAPHVDIVSGQRMLALLLERGFQPRLAGVYW